MDRQWFCNIPRTHEIAAEKSWLDNIVITLFGYTQNQGCNQMKILGRAKWLELVVVANNWKTCWRFSQAFWKFRGNFPVAATPGCGGLHTPPLVAGLRTRILCLNNVITLIVNWMQLLNDQGELWTRNTSSGEKYTFQGKAPKWKWYSWLRTCHQGRKAGFDSRSSHTEDLKTVLTASPASCSALMDGCKVTVHAQCCHDSPPVQHSLRK